MNFSEPTIKGRVLKTVFLLPVLDIGGAERVVLRTAAGLDRRRFDPTILAFCRGTGRLAAETQASGVPARFLRERNARSPLLVWQLFRWLRRHRADVLVSYMFHANITARVVGRLAGVRRIICSERVVGWESKARIAVNRATVRLADAVTTNSMAGVSFWAERLGLPPSRVRLIYNGVDTRLFQPRAVTLGEPVTIGTLARLHVANDHETLLAALARLASMDLPTWRCLIAGEGNEAPRLQQVCREAGLSDRVTFLGHRSTPAEFLRKLDIYVQPSLVAGMSNAVLEAMASGLPVVATNVGGTSEVVQNGATGLMVPPGDFEAMGKAIASLVAAPDIRASLGRAARARVEERFSLDRMVSDTAALIEEVVTGEGGAW